MSLDIVIVGGGISGLVAGIYAQKAGMSAMIVEKNHVAGGECTGWDREGFHIDNCLHWLVGSKPGSDLHRIWAEVGALDTGVHQPEFMYRSELDGESLTLWADIDRTEKELLALSPADADNIRWLMRLCRLGGSVMPPAEKPGEMWSFTDVIMMSAQMNKLVKLDKELAGMDTRDLAYRFSHPLIRAAITDFCPPESLANSFPMAYGNFAAGDGGIPRGGSRALAQRLVAKYKELGGVLLLGCPAVKIERTAEGAARGVTLKDGRYLKADYVIAACDTSVTFGTLLPKKLMEPMLARMYKESKNFRIYGMFQAAFAVDAPEPITHGDVMLEVNLGDIPWAGNRITVKDFAYEPDFAPAGKQLLQVMLGTHDAAFDWWYELYRRDHAAYDAEKTKLAARLQQVLEERWPQLVGKLRLLDSWTPVTYHRYCNAYRGYNQAFTPTKKSGKEFYPKPYLNNVPRLILAGQWMSPPGGLPAAAIQGKFAIQRILQREGKSIKV